MGGELSTKNASWCQFRSEAVIIMIMVIMIIVIMIVVIKMALKMLTMKCFGLIGVNRTFNLVRASPG